MQPGLLHGKPHLPSSSLQVPKHAPHRDSYAAELHVRTRSSSVRAMARPLAAIVPMHDPALS